MKKHAFLITAYDNLYVLDKCVSILDDEANDIFVHIDVKYREADEWIKTIGAKLKYSKITFIDRKDIKWGHFGYTEVILQLLSVAVKGKYYYYHLLTGTSLPIKSQAEIHNFFESDEKQMLYFHINKIVEDTIQERCKAYYPLVASKYFRSSKAIKTISLVLGKIQIALGVNRFKNSNLNPVYNGWGWFSIPHDFAEYACSQTNQIKKAFKQTLAPDEMWIHTVSMNSPFKERVLLSEKYEDALNNSKHFQDWERGKPYTFTADDYDLLMKDNPCFFARKFSDKHKEIVDMIYNELKAVK